MTATTPRVDFPMPSASTTTPATVVLTRSPASLATSV